jgi:hypothetical protein
MKKVIFLLFILTNFLFASVGQITALKGEIKITRDSKTILAKLGEKLEKSDVINSSKASKAQITLDDNTIITIGQNSTLNIFDYAFDETQPKEAKANLGFMRGSFKSITGKIGKINKERFKLKTKSASIGIRGTTIIGNQRMIAVTDGAISVTSNGVTVNVGKQEFTQTPQGAAPTPPEPLTPETLNTLDDSGNTGGGDNGNGGEAGNGDDEGDSSGNGGEITTPTVPTEVTDVADDTTNDTNNEGVKSGIDNKVSNNDKTKSFSGKQLLSDEGYSKEANITGTGTYSDNSRELSITGFENDDSLTLTTDNIGSTYDTTTKLFDELVKTTNEVEYDDVYSDNLGEFTFGYNSSDFWYIGTSVNKSKFNGSKIMAYSEDKYLNIDYSNPYYIPELENGSGSIFLNTVTKSVTYFGADKYEEGASYDGGYLDTSTGTFTMSSLGSYTDEQNITYSEVMSAEGTLFGSEAQGLGYTGNATITDSNNGTSTSETIGAAHLVLTTAIDTPSDSTTVLTGIYNNIYNNGTTGTQTLQLNINQYTGDINGATANESSYFIGNDLFGMKTTSGDGYLVALPDSVELNVDNDLVYTMNDDKSSWGYWTDQSSNVNKYSTWVAGEAETISSQVTSLMADAQTITATFSGHVLGAVTNNGSIDAIKFDNSNYANFTFNFGTQANNFTGQIGFETQSGQLWAVNIANETMDSSGFSSADITKDANYGSAIDIASTGNSINGEFYGNSNELTSIGGTFDLKDSNDVYNAVGVFKATKD